MLAFLGVWYYTIACVATGFALAMAVDGILPTDIFLGNTTPGFNGVIIGLIMMPEHFLLVPHFAEAGEDEHGDANVVPFNTGLSPANCVFLVAVLVGIFQSVLVFFLWRSLTESTAFDVPNATCGVLTFVLVLFGGTVLTAVAWNANALLATTAPEPTRHRRKR
jgi:hypothetical protein